MPALDAQESPSLSPAHFPNLATEVILQVILSCNRTTYPLDPVSFAMLQTISLLPFVNNVIDGSITSGHVACSHKLHAAGSDEPPSVLILLDLQQRLTPSTTRLSIAPS